MEKDELDKNFKLVEDASRKNEVDAYNMKVEFSNWKFKYKRIQDDINLLKSRALNMENHSKIYYFKFKVLFFLISISMNFSSAINSRK